jgi:hypothetical protein
MKTYAEVLQEKEVKMSNYDLDEIERNKRDTVSSITLGEVTKEKEYSVENNDWVAVDLELPDDIILKLSLEAHARDITLNKMINIALKDSLGNLEHRFEHENKDKQLLKEY